MSVNVGGVATNVGKGLFAGVVGTAAMTISSTLEMKIRVPSDEGRVQESIYGE
jgi:hypothetical protein